MQWIPKIHKNSTSVRFIIASKIRSTKQIYKSFSNAFQLVYSWIGTFHKNVNSYQIIKSFGRYKILTPLFNHYLKKTKEHVKSITIYGFSTLHINLKSKLSFIVDFPLKGRDKNFIILSNNGAAHQAKKTKGELDLIENGYFNS